MGSILNNPLAFAQAVEGKQPFRCGSNSEGGRWKHISKTRAFFRKLSPQIRRKQTDIGAVFLSALTKLETIPAQVGTGNPDPRAQGFLDAAAIITGILSKGKKSSKTKRQLKLIDRKMVALKYRMGVSEIQADQTQANYAKLEKLAKEWKGQLPIFEGEETLTDGQMDKLREAACYPEFVAVLESNKFVRADFFKWTLRDGNRVKVFVEYPRLIQRMKRCFLNGRIGFFGGNALHIEQRPINGGGFEKHVVLPFHLDSGRTESVSILDESKEVTFEHGYKITIGKVFDLFRKKAYGATNLEFFGPTTDGSNGGIRNWHSFNLGPWNPATKQHETIDLDAPNFWEQLPTYQTFTPEQLKDRFDVDVQPGQWVTMARATRESPNLDIAASHGFLSVAIPNADGNYTLFDFGKFAKDFPVSTWELLTFLTKTVEARAAYPDENPFFAHRQQAFVPYVISEDKGRAIMEEMRQMFKNSLDRQLVFQLAYENCASMPQEVLQRTLNETGQEPVVPNIYKMPILETKPSNAFLGGVFKIFRKLPDWIRHVALRIFTFIMGGFRWFTVRTAGGKKSRRNLLKTQFHKDHVSYIPPRVLEEIKAGRLPGVVEVGHPQVGHRIPKAVQIEAIVEEEAA